MTTATQNFVGDAFKQMTDGMTQAMQTGLKFQEEALRFWSEVAQNNMESVRSEWEKVQDRMGDFHTKTGDRFRTLAEEQTQRGMDLLRKNTDFSPTTDPAEMFDRMFTTWRSTADAMRDASQAMVEANVETFKHLCEVMPKVDATAGASAATTRRTNGKGRK